MTEGTGIITIDELCWRLDEQLNDLIAEFDFELDLALDKLQTQHKYFKTYRTNCVHRMFVFISCSHIDFDMICDFVLITISRVVEYSCSC